MIRVFAILALCAAAAAQTPCDRLGGAIVAGHCRVTAVLTPSSDSHIEIEVRMPVEGWNGKFLGVGNGGWAGSISTGAMLAALQEGYATASTDTGHKSPATPG